MYKTVDLCGKRFGKLTVLEKTDLRENKGVVWRCRCDCGKEVMVNTARLNNGTVKSCGCDRDRRQETIDGRYGIKLDLAGKRVGMLTVLEPTHQRQAGGVMWRCRCDCGEEILVSRNSLTHNAVKSCGCAKHKTPRNNAKFFPGPRVISGGKYAACIREICNYTDKDSYLSDLALSSIWDDNPDNIIPELRVKKLSKIWDAYHRPMKEIAKEADLSQRKLAERFCIPYRTMEEWCSGNRTPPDYVRMMMQECLGLL